MMDESSLELTPMQELRNARAAWEDARDAWHAAHSRYNAKRRSPERVGVKHALAHYEACGDILRSLRDKFKV